MIEANGPSKTCVLIIEDNPGDVEIIQMALQAADFDCDVKVIDEGSEAIEFVRRQGRYAGAPTPDLIVLDLNLPRYDGLEILRAMRQQQALEAVPVAVLSSSSSSRDRARLEGFNIEAYITKPSDLDEYLNVGTQLKTLVANRRATNLLREFPSATN